MPKKPPPEKPPVKFCPERGCGKKMAAFRRGRGWKYVCPDAPKHAQDKLARRQGGGPTGRGGVRKGTPSPKLGKEYPKPAIPRWRRKKEGGK